MDAINATMHIASAGMRAQGERLRVVSENLANANSTSEVAGGDPYRRKTVSFEAALDRAVGAELVGIQKIGRDMGDFRLHHDPAHPAANQDGYVKLPNVNPLVEMMDMREAGRSYQANLSVIQQARHLTSRTLGLLNR